MNEVALITCSLNGTITNVDHSALVLFGYSNLDELLTRNVKILIPPPYKVVVVSPFILVFACD
jgi:PAS domain S-box-containing protein